MELTQTITKVAEAKIALNKALPKVTALDEAFASFNAQMTLKTHKLKGEPKEAVSNLARCPTEVVDFLQDHYMRHPHQLSGFGLTTLNTTFKGWVNDLQNKKN